MVKIDETTQQVLEKISGGFVQKGAYNLRQNGIALCHGDSEHIKIKKKTDDALTVVMDKNPDILKALGERKEKQFLVGFAAETQNLIANAKEKICKKNLDMIVLNSLNDKGAGFSVDTNKVTILDKAGDKTVYELKTKVEVAKDIVDQIASRL